MFRDCSTSKKHILCLDKASPSKLTQCGCRFTTTGRGKRLRSSKKKRNRNRTNKDEKERERKCRQYSSTEADILATIHFVSSGNRPSVKTYFARTLAFVPHSLRAISELSSYFVISCALWCSPALIMLCTFLRHTGMSIISTSYCIRNFLFPAQYDSAHTFWLRSCFSFYH